MPYYNEYTHTFIYIDGHIEIICMSMAELIKQTQLLTKVNILQYLN